MNQVLVLALMAAGSDAFSISNWMDTNQFVFQTVPLCPVDLPLTCLNSTPIENSCCFESPGGLFAQTQFWDYKPAVGASDKFTLHGLWPDKCDGTWEQFCDSSLNIKKGDLEDIIVGQFGDKTLMQQIKDNWNNLGGDDESLWVHEFNKHATCVKTIRPECYGSSGKKNQNVYDYFKKAVALYNKYPTYEFLKAKGIVPSLTESYTFEQVSEALIEGVGTPNVFFKCDRNNALQEVWYYHYLKGPLSSGEFVPIDYPSDSRCPQEGIRFFPKGLTPNPPHPPKDPSGNSGYLRLGGHSGCLISSGFYYEQGTCAKFRLVELQFTGYNILSSKGVCGFDENGDFACNRKNKPSEFVFNYDTNSHEILYGGKSDWCMDDNNSHGPGKFKQTPIRITDGSCESFKVKLS